MTNQANVQDFPTGFATYHEGHSEGKLAGKWPLGVGYYRRPTSKKVVQFGSVLSSEVGCVFGSFG
jgi:hypothetical protein